MSRVHRMAIGGVLAALLVGGAWLGYSTFYGGPRAALEGDLAAVRASISKLNGELRDRAEVQKRETKAAEALLSGKLDVLNARFRDGLARVAEQSGLEGVVVENGQPQEFSNPVLNAKGVSTEFKRALRKSPEFEVVRGSVRGQGSLEQVLATLGTMQAQAWVHRVEAFTIRPVGKNRDRFEIRIDAATIYAPDLAGRALHGEPEPTMLAASGETEATWRRIADKNVFRRPTALAGKPADPPPVRVVEGSDPPAEPPAPKPFAPYEDWKLTGLAVGRTGPQALFLNLKTGDRLTVLKGGQFLDAVFVDGENEQAVVEIGGKRFDVSVGGTLATRKPRGS